MLTPTQAKIHDLVARIENLAPLAEAERLADVAHIENPWKGSIEALAAATTERDWLVEQQKAESFAREVERYRDSLERRENAAAEVAELDAKIATFSRETHDYFTVCNELTHWVEQATRPGRIIPPRPSSATPAEAFSTYRPSARGIPIQRDRSCQSRNGRPFRSSAISTSNARSLVRTSLRSIRLCATWWSKTLRFRTLRRARRCPHDARERALGSSLRAC